MTVSVRPLIDRLRDVELFAELDDLQLTWLAGAGNPVRLSDGDVLFDDGQVATHFYVLLAGELLITQVLDGWEHVLSRHSATPAVGGPDRPGDKPRAAHQFTGELPMIAGGDYVAKATAVGDTELIAYDKESFQQMLVRCPQVCRVLVPVLAWRIHSQETQAGRRAMLEGVGKLTAGLAHELNNPTAAVVRAAGELELTVPDLAAWANEWGAHATPGERALLDDFTARVTAGEGVVRPRDALDAAEVADSLIDFLDDRDVDRSGEFATILADHGVYPEMLGELADGLRTDVFPVAIACLCFSLHTRALVADVAEAGQRIEALVAAARSYTNLDRAPEQDIDLVEGLEATLAMHAPNLAGIRIRRDYADLPLVPVHPGELNQVWTNLIDNAIDAMNGEGELRISTRLEGGCAVVEIRDSGPGIDPDVLPSLFQPFFTTKDIGRGTGLGLYLSRNIITQHHNGSIDVTSVPGDTRFTVMLPLPRR
ncbi:ATP-binding protein [Kibdelosporangium persicum]|uniref:histidine kinase n=1 Tax=Kibdelosporangium persicum TaxID=2698649 RepID=A0ABX2F6M8_9PSEU|nr:ATP-binding protein [Kibdelosporangium persicum]NRN67014.1 Periplasmic sensor signal transduction histidine kinase [Kibdelosporangium persicum]